MIDDPAPADKMPRQMLDHLYDDGVRMPAPQIRAAFIASPQREMPMHGVLISTERPAGQKILVSGAPGAPGALSALSAAMVERLSPRTDRTPVVREAAAVPHFVTTEDEDARSAHVLDAVVYFDHPSRRGPGQLAEVIRFAAAAAAPIYFVTDAFDLAEPTAPDALLEACGLPYAIVRSSLVIGDSGTGRYAPTRWIGYFARALLAGSPPRCRFGSQRMLDFIPCDLLADAIARMIEFHVTDRVVWLTAGESALALEEIFDVLAAERSDDETLTAQPRMRREFGTGDHQINSVARSLLDRVVRDEPLPSSLGDRSATALGELGALGMAALPDPKQSLLATVRYWRGSERAWGPARGVA